MKYLAILTLAAFTVLGQEYTDSVRAMVGDTVITDYDLRQTTAAAIASLPPSLSPEARQQEIEKIQQRALDHAIDQELIYMEFQDLKGKVPMESIQEQLNQIINEQAGGSETRFREMLHRENITYLEFQEQIRKRLAVDWLRSDRCRKGISITNAKIQEYFQNHRAEFDEPTSYHIQVIQLKDTGKFAGKIEDAFGQIRQRLRNGESFEKLAGEYSEGASYDLGWQTSLAPILQKTVALLKPGEIYWKSLDIGDSTYLVRLVDRKGGKAEQLTPKLAAEIQERLFAQEAENNYRKYIETLYMKYPVRRF